MNFMNCFEEFADDRDIGWRYKGWYSYGGAERQHQRWILKEVK